MPALHRLRTLLFSLLIATLIGFTPDRAFSIPVEVHFVAGEDNFDGHYDLNNNALFATSSEGFDIIWRGDVDRDEGFINKPIIRSGTGVRRYVTRNGSGDCVGNLSSKYGGMIPLVTWQLDPHDHNRIVFTVQTPATNDGLDAFLQAPPGTTSGCLTPLDPLAVSGYQTTYNWTPSGPYPTETGSGDFGTHLRVGEISVNKNTPTGSVTITYSFDAKLFNPDNSLSEEIKNVWFGTLSVTTNTGATPKPVDPFTVFGYTAPPPGQLPQDPPPEPSKPVPQSEIEKWIQKTIFIPFEKMLTKLNMQDYSSYARRTFEEQISPRLYTTTVPPNITVTFDKDTRILTFANYTKPPATGRLAISATGKSSFAKSSGNAIEFGQPGPISFVLTKSALNTLKKGAAFSLKLSATFIPQIGKRTGKSEQVQIEARKKNR